MSGQLKVAPEHISPNALRFMGKPSSEVYEEFVRRYQQMNRQLGLKQYLVPYFMSSHPGCRLEDAVALAMYLKKIGHRPEQVQDFYPTPGTLSTAMFYTGIDPRDMQEVYVPREAHEKAMQRALLQFDRPQNRALVLEALQKTGREDLIGYGADCLIPPVVRAGIRGAEKKRPGMEKARKTRGSGTGKSLRASTKNVSARTKGEAKRPQVPSRARGTSKRAKGNKPKRSS